MRMTVRSSRARALVASVSLIAGLLAFGAGISSASAAPTCPTVDPSTGAVSPPPSTDADWSGCDLTGANLVFFTLNDMNLSGANLSNAKLMGAKVSSNLTDADFSGANMSGIDLTAANITGAIMATATISGIRTFNTTGIPASLPSGWKDIDFTILGPTARPLDAILSGADLSGLDLDQADLSGANLHGTNLSGTDLGQATLSGVESGRITATVKPLLPSGWVLKKGYVVGSGAYLNGANLSNANLAGLDLSSTNLAAADLNSANLTGTDMDSSDLSQADFTNANLSNGSAKNANLSESTLGGATTIGLNLTAATLKGANLGGADLDGATLTSIVTGSVIGTPVLPNGWALFNGYLVGPSANLSGADLMGLSLASANLSATNFSQADLEDASLVSANLTGAMLGSTDLTSANLSSADLTNTSLANANLTGTNLRHDTVTGADFTGVTWSDTRCPDGSNSNAHDSGCFSALDTAPPVASPSLLSAGTQVNGWFNAPVTVSWGWTDDGQINPAKCTHFSTTTSSGSITLTASCTDIAGRTGTASDSMKVDVTTPAVTVTGVRSGRHYIVGAVPAAGCRTTETISGVETEATVSVTTGGSGGVGPFTATCAGAVSVAGLAQPGPVQARYTVGYGFGGFSTPQPGSTIPHSARRITAAFRLVTASDKAISGGTASNLAWAHDVRVILRGPGIHPVTTYCAWSRRHSTFTCSIKVPANVHAGPANKYTITAQEDVGTGFYAVSLVGHSANPVIIHFGN